MRRLTLLALLPILASPATGSSTAAWAQLQRQAERSCVERSGFIRPRVSNMIVFDDSTGVVAILVTGIFRQRSMSGASGTNLCLYNRRTKKAVVEEAKGWAERR